jgi:hypothetical protein
MEDSADDHSVAVNIKAGSALIYSTRALDALKAKAAPRLHKARSERIQPPEAFRSV